MDGVTINARCADTKYKLLIREKVTVIRGQSGTGKTRLIDIIRNTVPGNPTYQVNVSHRLFISAPSAADLLRNSVESWKDTLVFVDERIVDSLGDYFCSLVRESEAYWIIISRNDDILRTIPFSMFEAYEFVKTNNVIVNKQIFSCDSRTFGGKFAVNTVTGFITEDSASGWYFFNKALPKAIVKDSASSNTKVVSTVIKHLGSSACILVLFDACAFGPFLGDLLSLLDMPEYKQSDICFYAMESFEWFLLHSLQLKHLPKVQDVLSNPYKYAYHPKYITYEGFYEEELSDNCIVMGKSYDKSCEDHPFYTTRNIIHLLSLIPNTDFSKVQIDTDMTESLNDLLKKHS